MCFGPRARVPSERKKEARKRRGAPGVRPPTMGYASEGTAPPRRSTNTSTRGLPRPAATRNERPPPCRNAASTPSMCLHVPRTIGSMVETVAGIGETLEAAHFYLVDATAARAQLERAENRLLRLDRLDSEDPGAAAPAAERDSPSSVVRQPCCGGRSSMARALRRPRSDVPPCPWLRAANQKTGA
jgi:hypothetical protein